MHIAGTDGLEVLLSYIKKNELAMISKAMNAKDVSEIITLINSAKIYQSLFNVIDMKNKELLKG